MVNPPKRLPRPGPGVKYHPAPETIAAQLSAWLTIARYTKATEPLGYYSAEYIGVSQVMDHP